ncbi:MAG: hypothetical protein A2V81_01795 [Candidatus Abawacabacteria bacterium RBG_16_42_10]|uniref:peptidoglycan glycosyltransferase n=1 Tax=Candidatus Abawacabacteria bacterium RBG_16_42_10 TaxID=1817814 RepID=A0A1F4XJJ9_9BACT|nr:MAG: hypothetical protein A2V81_01795 [Candidatus Abawacabacteria bacterium RBG_16_42_10]
MRGSYQTKAIAIIITVVLITALLIVLQAKNAKPGTIAILDRHGEELFSLQETKQKQTPIRFQEIPHTIITSTLAAEDKNFFLHQGIDWLATLRAMKENITSGEVVSGASTITQQLMRNILGTTRERSITNKITEMFLATITEHVLTKDQILEQYLNSIFYGYNTYGIAEASSWYFDTDFRQLDWNQATFLAVIPQNTSQFNPYTNFDAVRKRQAWLVKELLEENTLTQEEADFILQNPPTLSSPLQKITAPHFVHFVMNQLETALGSNFWHGHDVKVTTTLDENMYQESKKIINQQIKSLDTKNVHNAGGLVLDNITGEILSYVGNNDYFDNQNDGAVDMVQALRQPGSAMKPFIYLGAILKGWGTGTIIYDIPSRFQTAQGTPYTPLNYDLDYHGPVTVREALANSFNIPAVKTLDFLGINEAKRILQEVGISTLTHDEDYYGLSLALGSGEVSLYELTNAYRVLEQQGLYTSPVSIRNIRIDGEEKSWESNNGRPVWHKQKEKREEATAMITDILSDNYARLPEFGESSSLEFSFPVAAKTGTSRNFHDNWTLGYSTRYTVGVWVGNSEGSAMNQVSGITGAGPIFHELMILLHKQIINNSFTNIDNIPTVTICLPSGLLPNEYCTHKSNERFPEGHTPREVDTWYTSDGLTLPPELNFWHSKFATSTLSQTALKIVSPQNNDVFIFDLEIPDDQENIPCKIFQSNINNTQIRLNGEIIKSCTLPKATGIYELEVTGIDPQGQTITDRVRFTVS